MSDNQTPVLIVFLLGIFIIGVSLSAGDRHTFHSEPSVHTNHYQSVMVDYFDEYEPMDNGLYGHYRVYYFRGKMQRRVLYKRNVRFNPKRFKTVRVGGRFRVTKSRRATIKVDRHGRDAFRRPIFRRRSTYVRQRKSIYRAQVKQRSQYRSRSRRGSSWGSRSRSRSRSSWGGSRRSYSRSYRGRGGKW